MKIRNALFWAILLSASCASSGEVAAPDLGAAAGGLPDTEIFVASIDFSGAAPNVGKFENATKHKGYDNQPSFLGGEAAFYYVAANDSGKTDIRLYDIARGASQPVFTSIDRSEYSPREAPGGGVSYIQEDPTGKVTRVYRRGFDPSEEGASVVDFAPLGYYAWLDGGKALAVYYRSEPGSLHHVDVLSGATKLIKEGIGRTLQSNLAGDTLWYSELVGGDAEKLAVARYRLASGSTETLFDLPEGATDFFVVLGAKGDGFGYLSASRSSLYWRHADASEWAPFGTLGPEGVAAVSRIAVSDDRKWIAVVGELPATE